nr:MAG TPA: hypothetical protein [Caudoviricetes sp.]
MNKRTISRAERRRVEDSPRRKARTDESDGTPTTPASLDSRAGGRSYARNSSGFIRQSGA